MNDKEPTDGSQQQCSSCGAVITHDAPEGLCPACLLKHVVGTGAPQPDVPSAAGAHTLALLATDPEAIAREAGHLVGGGRYMLKSLIGRGGMGEVWLAHDERLHEDAALKFLGAQILFDRIALSDMRRETLRSRKLTHPNIVRIHDLHELPDEAPFISMEYVDGQNLTALRRTQPEGIFRWPFLSPLIKQLCAALDYAHHERVIHRDLKPANIMLDGRGRVKLADFGIAAVVSDSMNRLSHVQATSGTPPYMSPQQMDGQTPQVTDDIYALGATLYELLTGSPPFHTGEIAEQVRNAPAQPMEERLAEHNLKNEIPSAVSALVMACLAKDPALRPQSARAVAEWIGLALPEEPLKDLSQHVSGDTPVTISEPEASPDETDTTPRGNKKVRFAGVLAGLVLMGTLIGTAIWYSRTHRAQESKLFPAFKPGQILTDSVADFSDRQGFLGWYYGFWDRSADADKTYQPATDFQLLLHYSTDPDKMWTLQKSEYYTMLWRTGGHPNGKLTSGGRKHVEHWPVRRWVSSFNGLITVSGHVAKGASGGDGVETLIVIDGARVFFAPIDGIDVHGTDYSVSARVHIGSLVDFLIGPGPASADGVDGTKFTATIRTALMADQLGAKSETPLPSAIKQAPQHDRARAQIDRESTPRVAATGPQPWINSLGMRFVPVPGTEVLFSIWETRVQDFAAFVKATGHDMRGGIHSYSSEGWTFGEKNWSDPGFAQGPTHPVIGVNWNDAKAFCEWLTAKEQKAGVLKRTESYRLPSDLEWSAAVGLSNEAGNTPGERAGKIPNVYPWGSKWPPSRDAGNFAGMECRTVEWHRGDLVIPNYADPFSRTAPVGSFPPNTLGIFDLGGNVIEWCLDKYGKPQTEYTIRGSGWFNADPGALLSSFRYPWLADHRDTQVGFRIVLAGKSGEGKGK